MKRKKKNVFYFLLLLVAFLLRNGETEKVKNYKKGKHKRKRKNVDRKRQVNYTLSGKNVTRKT